MASLYIRKLITNPGKISRWYVVNLRRLNVSRNAAPSVAAAGFEAFDFYSAKMNFRKFKSEATAFPPIVKTQLGARVLPFWKLFIENIAYVVGWEWMFVG